MKTYIIVLVILIGCCTHAQISSVVVLKNGSEIRGKIIEQNETKVKIRTKDGSIWSYSTAEIAIIDKYQPKVSGPGIFMRVNGGIMGGSQVSPSFHLVNGYSINSHWDVGLGVGIESLWWDGYIPFFLNGRYNLLNKTATPFVDVIAGYEMPFSNWEINKGGFTTGTKIGFTKYLANRIGFSTSIGYRFAYLVEENNWWDDFRTIREINRIEVSVGFTFK
jgi:hypothetical protein